MFRIITPQPHSNVPCGPKPLRVCGLRGPHAFVQGKLVQVSPPAEPQESVFPVAYVCEGEFFDLLFRGLREGATYRLELSDGNGAALPSVAGLQAGTSQHPRAAAVTSLRIDNPNGLTAPVCPDTEAIACDGGLPLGESLTLQIRKGTDTRSPASGPNILGDVWMATFDAIAAADAGTWTLDATSDSNSVSQNFEVRHTSDCDL